jgi:hypothetical protein
MDGMDVLLHRKHHGELSFVNKGRVEPISLKDIERG